MTDAIKTATTTDKKNFLSLYDTFDLMYMQGHNNIDTFKWGLPQNTILNLIQHHLYLKYLPVRISRAILKEGSAYLKLAKV